MYNAIIIISGLALTVAWTMLSSFAFEGPVSVFVSFIGGLGIGACVGQLTEI